MIPKGSKEGHIKISIQGDTVPEAAENFHVDLSNISGAIFLGNANTLSSTVTIASDDDKLLPNLSVSAKAVYEGGEDEFTDYPVVFILSASSATDVVFHYETKDGDARNGSDYEGKSGDIIFLPGETQQTLKINVLGDADVEEDEGFVLYLSDPNGVNLAGKQPTQEVSLLIRDDDQGADTTPQKLEGTAKDDVLDATANGGYGDDVLYGLAGADTLIGGDGNDTYYVDNIKDVIVEEDQTDSAAGDEDLVHFTGSAYTLPANVENLIIDGKSKANATGNELNNKLFGNNAVNILSGLEGDDTFDSGAGNDTLTGGDGADIFMISSGIKGSKNVDTIKDFTAGEDKVYLSLDIFQKIASVANFSNGDEPVSIYDADVFVSGPKIKASAMSNYLLYDTSTGRVYYDADGSGKGSADWFLTLVGKPELTADDFYLF